MRLSDCVNQFGLWVFICPTHVDELAFIRIQEVTSDTEMEVQEDFFLVTFAAGRLGIERKDREIIPVTPKELYYWLRELKVDDRGRILKKDLES